MTSTSVVSSATTSTVEMVEMPKLRTSSTLKISAKKGIYSIYYVLRWTTPAVPARPALGLPARPAFDNEMEFMEDSISFIEGPQEVLHYGSSHFGSGGYYASALFTPGMKKISSRSSAGSFISREFVTIDYEGDGIAFSDSGDCIGDGGRSWTKVIIWGNPDNIKEQMAAARAAVIKEEAIYQAREVGQKFAVEEEYYDKRGGLKYVEFLDKKHKKEEEARIAALAEEARLREIFTPPAKPLVSKKPMRRL